MLGNRGVLYPEERITTVDACQDCCRSAVATYNRCVCFDVHQMSAVSSALKNHTELSGLVATQSFRHSLVCTLKTPRFFYAAVARGENHQRLRLAVCWRHVAGIWGKLKHLPLFLGGGEGGCLWAGMKNREDAVSPLPCISVFEQMLQYQRVAPTCSCTFGGLSPRLRIVSPTECQTAEVKPGVLFKCTRLQGVSARR